ncbi:MAG: class I SAM-dependent methyltransferase [Thermoproteota archaeon]|nr:class I SAM-dependent methyltransferase [Thermoproteota archaeon]
MILAAADSESKKEWSDVQHALACLNVANTLPHRTEGEAVLFEHISTDAKRILDLGTGDGRLVKLLKIGRSNIEEAIAVDASPTMLKSLREHFGNDPDVRMAEHDLNNPLSQLRADLGYFGAVVSSFAIHHLPHERKRSLYQEVYNILNLTGIFCNLEHVASPSVEHHIRFLHAIGYTPQMEDKSNKLLSMETQLKWLREIGFVDVDCYWK